MTTRRGLKFSTSSVPSLCLGTCASRGSGRGGRGVAPGRRPRRWRLATRCPHAPCAAGQPPTPAHRPRCLALGFHARPPARGLGERGGQAARGARARGLTPRLLTRSSGHPSSTPSALNLAGTPGPTPRPHLPIGRQGEPSRRSVCRHRCLPWGPSTGTACQSRHPSRQRPIIGRRRLQIANHWAKKLKPAPSVCRRGGAFRLLVAVFGFTLGRLSCKKWGHVVVKNRLLFKPLPKRSPPWALLVHSNSDFAYYYLHCCWLHR